MALKKAICNKNGLVLIQSFFLSISPHSRPHLLPYPQINNNLHIQIVRIKPVCAIIIFQTSRSNLLNGFLFWHGKRKSTAAAFGAFYPNFSAVFLHKFFTQDKPQAGSALIFGAVRGDAFVYPE